MVKDLKDLSEYYKTVPAGFDLWSSSVRNFLAEEGLGAIPSGKASCSPPPSNGIFYGNEYHVYSFKKIYLFHFIQMEQIYALYLVHPEGKYPSKLYLCEVSLRKFFGEIPKQFWVGIF
jgi:hypothetical protein